MGRFVSKLNDLQLLFFKALCLLYYSGGGFYVSSLAILDAISYYISFSTYFLKSSVHRDINNISHRRELRSCLGNILRYVGFVF